MKRITFTMKDGSKREFVERGRGGGSYTIRMKTDGEFAVVIDEWEHQTWIPSVDIAEITCDPGRSGW